ncbi:MAG: TonB-dependent receptor, partial [Bacteroidetes bacterium]|nr:TonB-dependent receptor [Bacteroidota bacterium]
LPSLNLKYNLNTKNVLRLGLSKTYTLPQSKEISPYQYVGMNFKSQGNPNLRPSDNYNVDIKWDYYLSGSELISITGFYKYIKNPIARIEVGNAGGYLTYRNISNLATVAGVETEIRKNIFNFFNTELEKTNKLTAGINASYIYSNLRVENIDLTPDKDSQLEGAAPFIVNFDLSHNYTNKKFSTTNSLVINYFSDRIYTIGTQGFEDIIEQGIPTLSFVSLTKVNKHFGLKIKAGNILDPSFTLTRKGNNGGNNRGKNIILSQYKKGIDLSLGITYEF